MNKTMALTQEDKTEDRLIYCDESNREAIFDKVLEKLSIDDTLILWVSPNYHRARYSFHRLSELIQDRTLTRNNASSLRTTIDTNYSTMSIRSTMVPYDGTGYDSKVLFRSADYPEHIRGYRPAYIVVEDVSDIPGDVIDVLRVSLALAEVKE